MSIHPQHQQLENRVRAYLEASGFVVDQATYHESLRNETVALLKRRYDPTALYIRGRADRIAIHRKYPITIEWEAKTHDNAKYHDMCIEALPLLHHIRKSQLGVWCLYAYCDPIKELDAGFWVPDTPPIRKIMLPWRWKGEAREWFYSTLREGFPGIPIYGTNADNGSGDPFVVIPERIVRTLPDWRQCIEYAVSQMTDPTSFLRQAL